MAILLVEDDPVVRLTLGEFLEEAGLAVVEAGDAEDALALLADRSQDISLLVTDLDLGPGDDGLVLAAKARRRWPELQVIYATGSPEKLEGHSVRPWEKVFFKPFDPAALAAAIFARGEAAPEMAR